MLRACTAAVVAVTFLASVNLASAASFQGLGFLPGGAFSNANGISADGSIVVGRSQSVLGTEAFIWTQSTGMLSLGDLSGGGTNSSAASISFDGSAISGTGESALGTEAFRWTLVGGMVGLGDLPGADFFSAGAGISGDGSVVTGYSHGSGMEGFRWTQSTGMIAIGGTRGDGASTDGSIIAGTIGAQASRWTQSTGMQPIGGTEAEKVSADGSVIVGRSGTEAFRWTQSTGVEALVGLPGTSKAYGISADGNIIVGLAAAPNDIAFIWDQDHDMRSVKQLLIDLGVDMTGWTLTRAYAASGDGTILAGVGIDPSGREQAWIATVPEPTVSLAVLALSVLTLRRRPRR